jgi:ubiquinone/menaquinone biosynthesis C-methylase UbiE
MFLSRRTTQEEYFDSERPRAEVAEFFQSLNRVNRFFDFSEPFRKFVPQLIQAKDYESLSILDLGAGDGSLGKTIQQWAANRGWNWHVVNFDSSLSALSLNPDGTNVAGSAIRLPFRPGSFDVIVTSQMVHHLADADAIMFLKEAWRVSRRAIIVCDLHRNLFFYLLLRLVFWIQGHPASFKADGLISVKKGWRVGELARLAAEAGIKGAKVKLRFGARIILYARKEVSVCESASPLGEPAPAV